MDVMPTTPAPSSLSRSVAQREYVRTFRFTDRVPRWRAHFYDAEGVLRYDMNQSETMPPFSAWAVCELAIEDEHRLGGGVEIDECK